MFDNKKVYSFHNNLVRARLEEIAITNSTLCTSLFIRDLVLKNCPVLKCTKIQRSTPKYIYDYICNSKDKGTRTSTNNKLLFRDFKTGHWNREQIKSILQNPNIYSFENPDNITGDDIDRLFESNDDSECNAIINSLTKCYKTPIICHMNYYKVDYLLSF